MNTPIIDQTEDKDSDKKYQVFHMIVLLYEANVRDIVKIHF
jgi:hypothetical protein